MEDKKPSPDWPAEGNVEFTDYSVRYREELDLVLRNISLKVKGGEKVSHTAQIQSLLPGLTRPTLQNLKGHFFSQ